MEATLIYPNQLFSTHPGVKLGRTILLIEDPLYFGSDPHWPAAFHVQKRVLHRASMRAYSDELKLAGHQVHYVDLPRDRQISTAGLLESHLPEKTTGLYLADPSDEILMKRIRRFAATRGIQLDVLHSPNFLSPENFLEQHIGSRKKPFMAKFYAAQRKRMGLLLDPDGNPHGGQWSFDAENRVKLPKHYVAPEEPCCSQNRYVDEARRYVATLTSNAVGSADSFRWPVTREDAQLWLDKFLLERFREFGRYEDAISIHHVTLHHGALTPMLNIGLLDPQKIIDQAVQHAQEVEIPLNSLEGFLRQIVGWREFMHGIYRHRGNSIRRGNFWHFERSMPESFYDGTTGIGPIDRVIHQLLRDGYCHHIERLMVLGNFMLLCRIKPDDVYRWFMEMFVDSYDWVMVPNIYGMSQFADGGTFTTKPYLSGSNYILKMSDEPKGPWCPIWDGLFWTFIGDYQPFFLGNPRLSMMARTWEKMSPEKQEMHRKRADGFLTNLS